VRLVDGEEYLTRHEAAERAGVSFGGVTAWIDQGLLEPATALQGGETHVYIKASHLDALVERLWGETRTGIDPTLVWAEEQ